METAFEMTINFFRVVFLEYFAFFFFFPLLFLWGFYFQNQLLENFVVGVICIINVF